MGTGELNAGGNPVMDQHPIQGGVEILLFASCYRNQDKLRPDGPLGSYADFTLPCCLPQGTYNTVEPWLIGHSYMQTLHFPNNSYTTI